MKGSNNILAERKPALSQTQRILNVTANFYHELLTHNLQKFKWVYEYLERHRIMRADVKRFSMGFCPSLDDGDYDGRALVRHYHEEFDAYPAFLSGFTGTGLIKKDNRSAGKGVCDRFFDTFAGCTTFPLYDLEGKIHGMVGRNMSDGMWTFVGRSPDWLYGIHKSRYDIEDRKTAVIVETIFDFFSFYEIISHASMNLAVATISDHLTTEVVGILSTLAVKDFFIAMDLDDLHRLHLQKIIEEKGGRVHFISHAKEGNNTVESVKHISNQASDPYLKKLLREAAEAAEKIREG